MKRVEIEILGSVNFRFSNHGFAVMDEFDEDEYNARILNANSTKRYDHRLQTLILPSAEAVIACS